MQDETGIRKKYLFEYSFRFKFKIPSGLSLTGFGLMTLAG